MELRNAFALFLLAAPIGFAQLTPAQKVSDFMQLAGVYAKNYGPYQEKKTVYGFDLYDVQPWINQVQQSTTDLEFYDICVRYVASLRDFHDEFTINSDFDAWLHFNFDLYDGKFLIDFIDPSYPAVAGLNIGDQLVSVDGVAVADLLTQFTPYSVNGESNPVSQQRLAAATITERAQVFYPGATNIKTSAVVVVNQKGKNVSYTIPWDVTGTPVAEEGPVPSPLASSGSAAANRPRVIFRRGLDAARSLAAGHAVNSWGLWTGTRPPHIEKPYPDYMKPIKLLSNLKALSLPFVTSGLNPFGNQFPVFNAPSGFQMRLGSNSTDEFLSGTFPVGSQTIGFIRIYTMIPMDETNAINQFASEIAYFQANTNGLVVDIMANGGGDGCYAQTLATYLIPTSFHGLTEEIRATLFWQFAFSESLLSAEFFGAPQWQITSYQQYLKEVKNALAESRGNTGSLPLCGPSSKILTPTDSHGNSLAYTKPILVLVDNFTASAAEVFAMFLQDTKRATLFGTRTSGGGGNVVSFDQVVGAYSEGSVRVTLGLITRAAPVQTPGFPLLPSYDGVGIYPDIVEDYMTSADLATGGQPFVAAFSSAISSLIKSGGK